MPKVYVGKFISKIPRNTNKSHKRLTKIEETKRKANERISHTSFAKHTSLRIVCDNEEVNDSLGTIRQRLMSAGSTIRVENSIMCFRSVRRLRKLRVVNDIIVKATSAVMTTFARAWKQFTRT